MTFKQNKQQWKVVPVEATHEMESAAAEAYYSSEGKINLTIEAAIEAAPPMPKQGDVSVDEMLGYIEQTEIVLHGMGENDGRLSDALYFFVKRAQAAGVR